MQRDYQPISGYILDFKSTTQIAYDKEYSKNNLNRDSFYITTMPKTIRQMLPSNIYLNYMNLCGLVWIDPSVTEETMNEKGFVKINVDKDYMKKRGYDIEEPDGDDSENLHYIENITHNKFVIQLSKKSNYFNLYVPVNNRFIGKYDEVTNNLIVEAMSRNNYIADMKIKITGKKLPEETQIDDSNENTELETVIFTPQNYELYSDTILLNSGANLIFQTGLSPIKLKNLPNGYYKIEALDLPENYYPIQDIEFLFENGLITIDDNILGVNRIVINYEPILSDLVTDNLIVNLDASDLTVNSTSWTNRINQNSATFTFGKVNEDIYNAENNVPKLPIITGTSYLPNTTLLGENVDLLNNNTMYIYLSIYLNKLSDIIQYTNNNYGLSNLCSTINKDTINNIDYLKPTYTINNEGVLTELNYSTRLIKYNNLDISLTISQIADSDKILLSLTTGSDNIDKGIYIYNSGKEESIDDTKCIYSVELEYTFDSVNNDIIFTNPEPINMVIFNRILDNINTYDIYINNELVFTSDTNFNLNVEDSNVKLFYNLQENTGYNLQTFGAAYIHSIKMYNKVLSRRELEQNVRFERKTARSFNKINEPEYLKLDNKSWLTGALDSLYTVNRPMYIYEYINISRYIGTNTKMSVKLLHSQNKPFIKYNVKCYCYDKYCNLLTDLTAALHYNEPKNTMDLIILPSTFNSSAKYIRFGFELVEDEERNGALGSIIPQFSMLYIYNATINSADNEIFFDDRANLPILYNPFDGDNSYGNNVFYAASMEDTSDIQNTNNYTITYHIGNKIKAKENNKYRYDSTNPSLNEYKIAVSNIITNRLSGINRTFVSEESIYNYVADIEQYFKYHNTVNAFKLDRGNHLLDSDCLTYRYRVFFFDINGNYLHNDTNSITYNGWYDENDYIMLPYNKTNIKYVVLSETIYIKNQELFDSRYSDIANCASTLWNSLYNINNGEYTLKPLPNNMTNKDVEFIVDSENSYSGKYANLINCFEKNDLCFFTV